MSLVWLKLMEERFIHKPIRSIRNQGEVRIYVQPAPNEYKPSLLRVDGCFDADNGQLGVLEYLECG